MSLIFKPKIPLDLILPVLIEPVRSRLNNSPWSDKDMTRLILLRAMNIPFGTIGKMLKKANGTCCFMVRENELEDQIKEIHERLIASIMDNKGDGRVTAPLSAHTSRE